MGPCKLCIVKACCNKSKECMPYKLFIKNASAIVTFISVMLAGILVVIPLIYLTEYYPDKEFAKSIIQLTWFVCAGLNVAFSWKHFKENKAIFFEIFFGPFCTLVYSFLFIGAKIIVRT